MAQKTWVVGEEVLAADFNTYVQNQVVARFATVAARDAAWPAATAGAGAVSVTVDTGSMWFVVPGPPVAWRAVPWGVVASSVDNGQVSTSGGVEIALSVSSSFQAPGGRRYKITAHLTGAGTVVGDSIRFAVRRGSGVGGTAVQIGPAWGVVAAGYTTPFLFAAYDVPPAGAQQYTLCVARIAGTGVFTQTSGATYNNALYVEDIGT